MCIDQEMKGKIFPLKQQGLHARTFHHIDDSEEHNKMNHLVDLSNQIVMKKNHQVVQMNPLSCKTTTTKKPFRQNP
jgi:hypothetical protein